MHTLDLNPIGHADGKTEGKMPQVPLRAEDRCSKGLAERQSITSEETQHMVISMGS